MAPVFGDDSGRGMVAGISLGNEPDLTYSNDLARYLGEFPAYGDAEAVNQWPRVMPATSENIGSWRDFKEPPAGFSTRWFWNWPAILDAVAPTLKQRPGPLEPAATDHFYPLARTCSVNTPYRCPSIARLLEPERVENFDYQVYTHAAEAAARGLRYRMDETNTAAGRGAPGVSDVAASATWTLDTLFNAACPQPPDQPGANADCHLGATGVNFHNAELNAYFRPQEGNAYYNAIRYDPTPAAGTPTPGPSYYALLLFARLAQGTTGLRPVSVDGAVPVTAWEVRAGRSERRLFLINKGAAPVTVQLRAPAARIDIDRMTPHDPSGAGRTLDAPDVRLDGQAVAPDGTFPDPSPTTTSTHGGQLPVTIAPEKPSSPHCTITRTRPPGVVDLKRPPLPGPQAHHPSARARQPRLAGRTIAYRRSAFHLGPSSLAVWADRLARRGRSRVFACGNPRRRPGKSVARPRLLVSMLCATRVVVRRGRGRQVGVPAGRGRRVSSTECAARCISIGSPRPDSHCERSDSQGTVPDSGCLPAI